MAKSNNWEFLLSVVFGEERTIKACARLAYRDIRRNLSGVGSMPPQDKQAWREEIEGLIDRCLEELSRNTSYQREAFDVWHKQTCEQIIELSGKHGVPKEFTYGLAQKWLNMTIKNMLVMEQWDWLVLFKDCLHVPVDSYIMEAAVALGIELIDKKGQFQSYKAGVSKPWSQWDYSEYDKFQKKLREIVPCPMDWEFDAWREVKAKRENKKSS